MKNDSLFTKNLKCCLFQSETMISFDDINNYTNIMSEQGSLLEQMTPLASPDSGYGEGCQIFHMSKVLT